MVATYRLNQKQYAKNMSSFQFRANFVLFSRLNKLFRVSHHVSLRTVYFREEESEAVDLRLVQLAIASCDISSYSCADTVRLSITDYSSSSSHWKNIVTLIAGLTVHFLFLQAATSAKTVKRDSQTMKTPKRPTPAKANAAAPVQARRVGRPPGKVSKKNGPAQSTATKVKCTQCGSDQLTDVTGHEFANKKGLVFECTSCGNTSLRSNASPAERRARLNQVATDHLDHVKCQFCQMLFTSHPDYMKHLKNDHGSDKPT